MSGYVGDPEFDSFIGELELLCAKYGILQIDAEPFSQENTKLGKRQFANVRLHYDDDSVKEVSTLCRIWFGRGKVEGFWTPERFIRLIKLIPEDQILDHENWRDEDGEYREVFQRQRAFEQNPKKGVDQRGRHQRHFTIGSIRYHFDLDRGHHQLNDILWLLNEELDLKAEIVYWEKNKEKYPNCPSVKRGPETNCFFGGDNVLTSIEKGYIQRYQQATPRERVLAALEDAKKFFPSWEGKGRYA